MVFMSLHIPAIPFKQRNIQMYIATVPVSMLERFQVDTWNPKSVLNKRGYQRNPDEQRIKKIAKYFEKKDSIMPVAGLLNVRNVGKLKYAKGQLIIPDGTDVWVVDMQHRLKGLHHAKDRGSIDSNFFFPVVIVEGLDRLKEAAQFYLINTKAKKMDVALTRRLLIENDYINEIADVKPWEISAVHITIDLNKEIKDNPWFDAIRQPNEERLQTHIATEKSFVSSLRQVLISGKNKQHKKVAKRLAKFWSMIEEAIPEAFKEPKRYLIQKTPGIFVFNFFIAPHLLNKWDEKKIRNKVAKLTDLGADFWKRTNKTGARRFGTGMGAYAELANFVLGKIN